MFVTLVSPENINYNMFCSDENIKSQIKFNKQEIEVYSLEDNSDYSIQISSSIKDIRDIWDYVAPESNLFMQSPYLKTLEDFPPEKMGFRYILFYKDNQPVGISYNQIFRLKIEDSVQKEPENGEEKQQK